MKTKDTAAQKRGAAKRRGYAVHVCSFSAGLDEMKRKDQRDPVKVLKVLHRLKRFSIFEATQNDTIAGVMDDLVACGYIDVDNSPGYPWSNVRLTPKGIKRAGLTSEQRSTASGGSEDAQAE